MEIKSLYKLLGIRDVYYALDRLSMVMRKKGGMKLRGKAAQVKGVIEPFNRRWRVPPAIRVVRPMSLKLECHGVRVESWEHWDAVTAQSYRVAT